MLKPDEEMRIVIRVRVTDIPGDMCRRHTTLGELFSKKVLFRPIKQNITPEGYDGVVLLPGFDSQNPIKAWFIYDLNVKGKKTQEELLATVHKVYLACKQEEDWTFVSRDIWIDSAKQRSKSYVWGGKVEQEWLAQMRQTNVDSNEATPAN